MTHVSNSFNWRIKDILDDHQISVYRLAQELAGKVSRNTVYSTVGGSAKRVDLATLGNILAALRSLTGNIQLDAADLLEYVPVEVNVPGRHLGADPNRATLTGTVQKLKRRGPPPPLAQPTDMTAIVAELRGKVE